MAENNTPQDAPLAPSPAQNRITATPIIGPLLTTGSPVNMEQLQNRVLSTPIVGPIAAGLGLGSRRAASAPNGVVPEGPPPRTPAVLPKPTTPER
jgi:hypothetical protein